MSVEHLQVAVEAAQAAGALIRDAVTERGGPRQISHKGAIDLVTEVDLAAERCIVELLERRCPGVPVLAEEGSGASVAATRWVIDPLDGTTNFVHGFPAYAVSIGFQAEGEVVAGCIYDPVRGETWTAAKGRGAARDGQPIRVSGAATLGDSLLITGFPYDRRERAAYYLRFVQVMLERAHGVLRNGAASLDFCHVASGRADGFWELGLAPWDMAAGSLLVREAGGRVTDLRGGPFRLEGRQLLATNGRIHDELALLLDGLLSSGE
jgi:myo-inositol-1(or 4)-monophosphatase